MSASLLIAQRIRDRGPMTVAEFMSIALYHPEHGYYSGAAHRTGRSGDFFTSVDVGPLFGRLLARQFAEMWQVLEAPGGDMPLEPGLDLVEVAAANGQLALDVLSAAAEESPAFYAATRLHLVETSPAARAAQLATLGPHASRLASSSAKLPNDIHGIVYANELLDALPVHAVVQTATGLAERYVSLDERDGVPRFIEQIGPLSNDAIGRHLASLGVQLEPGARAEVNLSALAWLTRACSALHRGFLVLIDYGHPADQLYSASHAAGTLTSFVQHVNPADGPADSAPAWLQDPGSRDITSHVDLTSVQRVAEALGCETLGVLDQTYFLMALAGMAPSKTAQSGADRPGEISLPTDPRSIRAFKTLMMPGGLGSTMKVMVFSRNVGRPLLMGLRGPARLT